MNAAELTARILKREGIEFLACYPRNALIDACAGAGIRPLICRQERVGVGIADGYARAGNKVGVFASQSGPGIENAYPGVAQAFADNVPVLVLPSGSALSRLHRRPTFDAVRSFASITKWAARAHSVAEIPGLLHRAFHLLRTGRGGPVLVEVPAPVWQQEYGGELDYEPARSYRSTPDPADVEAAGELLLAAKRPVIQAGQGVIRADATASLVELAELLDAPVFSTNPGKSAFPEDHPLSLGGSAVHAPPALTKALDEADLVFAAGSSLTFSPFNPPLPKGKQVIQLTNAEDDINKEVRVSRALLGDARLGLDALVAAVRAKLEKPRGDARAQEALAAKSEFLAGWSGEFESDEVPLSPYRVIAELANRVDAADCIVTHDSGSPREHFLPFWESRNPGGYIGWGKTTQLGHSLGLMMGAKLAQPEKTCIAVAGDAAFCMTGLDIDTAVKNDIAILMIVLNNGVMAMERDTLKVSAERFGVSAIGGDYAGVAAALGCWSRRIEAADDIGSAFDDALAELASGKPAVLEFITKKCYDFAGITA